ncbi:MAG: hypothetical protein JW982_12745 [Spirochaetes bacterium]|nr:hypothetical protein [Spirochaetota bacterium]
MKAVLRIFLICIFFTLISVSVYSRVSEITYENAVIKEEKKDKTIYEKPDGTVITKYADREIAVFKDGTQIDFNHKTGIKQVSYKDGSRLIVNYMEGTRTSVSSDGQKEVFDYKGKTIYGDSIAEIKRIVQKEPVLVEFIFNPFLSDDSPDKFVQLAYNKFFDALYKRIASKKFPGKNNLTVEMGFCHFGTYGKCYGILNKVFISFKSGNKVLKTFEFNSLLFKDEKKLEEFSNQIYEYFLTI